MIFIALMVIVYYEVFLIIDGRVIKKSLREISPKLFCKKMRDSPPHNYARQQTKIIIECKSEALLNRQRLEANKNCFYSPCQMLLTHLISITIV